MGAFDIPAPDHDPDGASKARRLAKRGKVKRKKTQPRSNAKRRIENQSRHK